MFEALFLRIFKEPLNATSINLINLMKYSCDLSEHIFYGGAGAYFHIQRDAHHKEGWEPLL